MLRELDRREFLALIGATGLASTGLFSVAEGSHKYIGHGGGELMPTETPTLMFAQTREAFRQHNPTEPTVYVILDEQNKPGIEYYPGKNAK